MIRDTVRIRGSELQVKLAQAGRRKKRNWWLDLIAVYKLLQSVLLIGVGVGARRLVGQDVGEFLGRLAHELRMNSEGRLVQFVIDKSSLVDDRVLRRISVFLFCYAALGLLEGIGLILEKVWAEYFTALITASFLPFEIFELAHRVTWIRIGLLVVNLAVLAYLVAHLIRRRRESAKQN